MRALIALDGTPNKTRLGGNAMIATSMAAAQAAANAQGVALWHYLSNGKAGRLPLPEIQIFGGGAHAARRVDVQDFMIVCPRAASFAEALDITAQVYRAAGKLLAERGLLQGVADEGGYWPAFASNEEALDMVLRAIERAGFSPGERRCDLARHRGFLVRQGRPLPPGAGRPRTRQRRPGRDARRLD